MKGNLHFPLYLLISGSMLAIAIASDIHCKYLASYVSSIVHRLLPRWAYFYHYAPNQAYWFRSLIDAELFSLSTNPDSNADTDSETLRRRTDPFPATTHPSAYLHACRRIAPSGRVLPTPFPGPQIVCCHCVKPNGRADAVFRTVFDSKIFLDAHIVKYEASIVEAWKRIFLRGSTGAIVCSWLLS
jgi:hypothetical protein